MLMRPINQPTAGRRTPIPGRINRMLQRITHYRRPAFICSCVLVLFYTESPRVIQTGRSLSLRSDNFSRSGSFRFLLSDCASRGVLRFPERGGAAV